MMRHTKGSKIWKVLIQAISEEIALQFSFILRNPSLIKFGVFYYVGFFLRSLRIMLGFTKSGHTSLAEIRI